MRRRLLGILAVPLLVGQCGPSNCTPNPPPSTSYAFLIAQGDQYARWDPCGDPITYQIDTSAATGDAQAIHDAVAAAAAATGFTFEFAGDSVDGELGPDVDALIGYDDFPGSQLGEGGIVPSGLRITEGFAYADVGLDPALNRHVMLHEIAHLLGLDHTVDDEQVMFSYVSTLFAEYQPGDLEGLRLVGATMPCFPAARALERAPQAVTWTD